MPARRSWRGRERRQAFVSAASNLSVCRDLTCVLGAHVCDENRNTRGASLMVDQGEVLWCVIEIAPIWGLFWPFLRVRAVSAKTATFWPRSHQTARLTAQRDGT